MQQTLTVCYWGMEGWHEGTCTRENLSRKMHSNISALLKKARLLNYGL